MFDNSHRKPEPPQFWNKLLDQGRLSTPSGTDDSYDFHG
jgi:hypothetical protein